MKGGEYLSSGIYGCTCRPNLECARRRKMDDPVGKVFDDNEAFLDELKFNKIIKKIDPDHSFTIEYYGTCKFVHRKIKHSDETFKCNLFPFAIPKQILMKYGGISLKKATKTVLGLDYIRLFYPLFEGIQKLQSHKYAHTDIKPDNILYSNTDNKLYLIDFGLMQKFSKVKNNFSLLMHDYTYYPPEMKILASKHRVLHTDLYNFILGNYDSKFFSIPLLQRKITGYDYQNELMTAINFGTATSTTKYTKLFDPKKLDSYSLAITMYSCIFFSGNESKYTSFLQDILFPAINPNFLNRISIDEILLRYKRFLVI